MRTFQIIFNFLIIVLVIGSMYSCNINDEQNQMLTNDFDSIHYKYTNEYIASFFPDGFRKSFSKAILSANKDFELDLLDSVDYFMVPALNIDADDIEGKIKSVKEMFQYGELSQVHCNILVIHDEVVVTIMSYDQFFYPLFGNMAIRKIDLDVLENADYCFKIMLNNSGMSIPIPGMIFNKDNKYHVISYSGDVLPLDEIHQLRNQSKDEFKEFINSSLRNLKGD